MNFDPDLYCHGQLSAGLWQSGIQQFIPSILIFLLFRDQEHDTQEHGKEL